DPTRKPPRGLAQDLIGTGVAEGILQLLKPVDRKPYQYDFFIAAGGYHRLLEAIAEKYPVRQVCERVVICKVIQLIGSLADEIFELFFIEALSRQQLVMIESPLYRKLDKIYLKRLADIVKGTDAHRLDCDIDSLIAADHNDDGVG